MPSSTLIALPGLPGVGENRESGSRHSAAGDGRSPRSTASTTEFVHNTSEVDQIHSIPERRLFTRVVKVLIRRSRAVTPSSEFLRRWQGAGDIPARLTHALDVRSGLGHTGLAEGAPCRASDWEKRVPDGKRRDCFGTCRRATREPGLDVVDVAAADDTAAVLFQRMLAER
ncbi:DUF6207 family protein [Streptomyces longwoodensis]|uniref:DUF6207 family protein n=1 Tax=Streptomyces longwoodensis TaxID=68231 RepID=UPI003400E23C